MISLRKRSLKVERITASNFKSFGTIIDYPAKSFCSKTKNLFRIVIRQPRLGWRIAYLVVRDKSICRLEQHPGSFESFEPVSGQGILFVSLRKNPHDIRSFLIDKPVILKKGLWHGIVTTGEECDVKIVENSRVKCVYWPLGFELHV